jgi:DNA-binding NtrC family response regulator
VKRVLLVDDNRALAENLAEILRDVGHEPTVVERGEAAVEAIGRERFDVLVTDMRMPEMGGARVVHEVRRVDPGLPAIVVTAFTGDADLALARREGLLAILPKPVPVTRLIELLGAARRDGLVALVEDDPELADNLAEAFRTRGFTAVTAGSVLETEQLAGLSPFAALADVRVPGGPDGEAIHRLRARFPHLPLVAITGHPDGLPSIDYHRTFLKPFDTAALLHELEALHRGARG